MVYLLIFLSGVAALVYEVVWARQLATFLGITTYAHTIVLASFMAGLAIGAWVFGKIADRSRDPLLLFAALELGIGCLGIVSLASTPLLQQLYAVMAPDSPSGWAAQGVRLTMAGIAVLPATTLMGGTLPALVRGLFLRPGPLGRTVAAIYGVNTMGAAAGALASAYLLLPVVGTRGSLVAAVVLNFAAATGTVVWRRFLSPQRTPSAVPPSLDEEPLSEERRRLLLVAFGLSGAAALALQLGWIRALTQVLGSSVYAFGLTSASYLFGLAIGSSLAVFVARRLARTGATLRAAALLEAGTGLAVIGGLPILGSLPEVFLAGYRVGIHQSFAQLQIFAFLLASAVLIVPTMLLGALYPLLTARAPRQAAETGGAVGAALAANSLGTVLGTLAAGLLLLPLLGADGLLRGASILCCVVAALLWRIDARRASTAFWPLSLAGVTIFAVVAVSAPRWDSALMTSGPFINAARFVDVPPGEELRDWLRRRSRILYYREGVEASVSVRDVGAERLLVINGKTDGSRFGDRRTQLALAHLPLLSHSSPRRVLLIGLGTGMSAAAVAADSRVESLAVVEISREVIEASHFFIEENESVLADPRLRLERADARNFLLTTEDSFDIVLSEPSNPWITGVSNLFTREFFALARERLAPEGIMAQWFQTYGMSEEDFKSVLRSFSEVFPNVTVWSPQLGDLLFLGSLEQTPVSVDTFRTLKSTPKGRSQLESIDLTDISSIARLFLLDDRGVRSFVANARPNTDDFPRVEFNAPRNLYSETTLQNLTAVIKHLDERALTVPLTGVGELRKAESPRQFVFDALGISVTAPSDWSARVAWRVSWTTLQGDFESGPSPVGVGNRPTIVLATDRGAVEIERGFEDQPLERADLEQLIRVRWQGSHVQIDETRLRSGEDMLLATGAEPAGSYAMAWSCGSQDGRHSRYIATGEARGATPGDTVRELARRLECRAPGS